MLLEFKALYLTLVFLSKKSAVFSTKKVSHCPKEVHETFSKTSFCTRFVISTSLAVNEKSYFILSVQQATIFVSVYDAPFELADEAIVKGLECQVLNTYRYCH